MKFDIKVGDAPVVWVAAYKHRNGLYTVVLSTPTVKTPAVVLGSLASSERPGLDRLVDLYATNGDTLIGSRPTRVLLRAEFEAERRALCGELVQIGSSSWTVELLAIPGGVLGREERVGTWDAAPFVDPLGRL
jgi:hypothetical protein